MCISVHCTWRLDCASLNRNGMLQSESILEVVFVLLSICKIAFFLCNLIKILKNLIKIGSILEVGTHGWFLLFF